MPAVSFEGKGVKRSGERFDITLWHRAIHYLGEPASMIFVADNSEAKALRSQLLQAQKMEAVGTLAGGIAHDFNNILAVIQTTSELILLSDGEDAVSHVQRMLTACRRGADMVQRLLAFSRKVEPKLCPIDLNHEVVQFRGLLESMISRMIPIELHLDENLPAISGDVTQIEQVLMNLASNSRDAMPDGGTLTIETRTVTGGGEGIGKDGSYVMLSVSDTGKGIEKEFMNHIFEPFATTKETGKGTGLGLSTVYGIVEQHNGYIRCDSELEKGTTFRLYFPVEDWQEKTRKKIEIEPESRGGNETILLVDDEDLIRELAQEFLTETGYTVLTAGDGKRALEVYQQNAARVDLVILDLVMPHMGGRQCLEKLLGMNPHLKILISSGSAINGNRKELIDAGAVGVVKKPYSLTEMLTGIRIALDATPNKTATHSDRQSSIPAKKKIDALEALLDLRDGMSHAQLMGKHGLTRRGLMSLLIKLQEVREAHGISDIDLDRLRTVERKVRKTDALSSSRKDTEFSGNINNIDILEIFQFLVITGRRVVLAVSSQEGERGFIFIDKGMVKHAQCDQLKGEAALFRCLSFDGGSFANLPWREPDAITIDRPGDFIIMEATRKRNDARAGSNPCPPIASSSPGELRVAYKL